MWNYFKYRLSISKLRKTEARIRTAFEADIKSARAEGKVYLEIEKIKSDMHFEMNEIQDEIQEIASIYMINIARQYFIPTPDFDDESMWVERYGYKILSNSGISFIREKREQQKIRVWSIYGSAIGATTGLVGACAAVLALMK